jgi:hypothetical protein
MAIVESMLILSWLAAGASAPAEPVDLAAAPPAAAAFERFKSLAGTWRGQSTRGWEDEVSIATIAGGSAVRHTSFEAHPGEQMETLVHLDGDRLLLTHYCVARNQPRLVATSFAEGGRVVTFEFLDGTGMASRDVGHMDKVVVRFADADHWSSRWTWYANGQERWLEEIHYQRQR